MMGEEAQPTTRLVHMAAEYLASGGNRCRGEAKTYDECLGDKKDADKKGGKAESCRRYRVCAFVVVRCNPDNLFTCAHRTCSLTVWCKSGACLNLTSTLLALRKTRRAVAKSMCASSASSWNRCLVSA
jgi:hypothetical protein